MQNKKIFLLPGELHCSREPIEYTTLLGSCVAVCLYNRKLHFGGMNHFMLSHPPEDETPCGKYGDYSTELLIRMMKKEDLNLTNIDATVIGGGNVTGHLTMGTGIGANNIIMARDILNNYNLRIVNTSTGSDFVRKRPF